MADVKDIYDLILSGQPGGGYSGIYKPSGPVMLPPQGMGSNQALGRLLSDPTGPGPDSGALSGMLDDPIYSGAAPYSGQQTMPHANGTQVASKDQSRLGTSPAGNLFAYGSMNQTPAQKAISIATNLGGGLGMLGEQTNRMFPTEANGMPIDSSIPSNIVGSTRAPVINRPAGLAALAPPPAPVQAPGLRFLQQQGQKTQGLTAGEVANNLKAAMGSHNRGSFGAF